MESILDGLLVEYDAFTTSVSIRIDPFTVGEIQALLMAQETRIEKNNTESTLSTNLANVPFKNHYSNSSYSNNQMSRNHYSNSRGNYGNYQNSNFNNRGRNNNSNYRGRGRRGYSGNNAGRPQITCQICNKDGHLASTCFFRYDQSPSNWNLKHSVQLAEVNQSVENCSDPSLPWFPDSGASTHVTSYCANLQTSANYSGQDKLHMGDGSGIPI